MDKAFFIRIAWKDWTQTQESRVSAYTMKFSPVIKIMGKIAKRLTNRLFYWEYILLYTVITSGNNHSTTNTNILRFSGFTLLKSHWNYIFNTDRQYSGIHSHISKIDQECISLVVMFSITLRLLSQILQYCIPSQLSHTTLTIKRQHTGLPTSSAILLTQRFSPAENGKKI